MHSKSLIGIIGYQLLLQVFVAAQDVFRQCNNTYYLQPNRATVLQSPYYPYKYPSGSACLYTFVAPLDYEILTECNINLDRNPSSCSTEYFYISKEGDRELRDAEYFCGSQNITRTSLFRNLAIAYTSAAERNSRIGGRFTCRLITRPQACDCGWSTTTRIVGGQQASLLEFPSMVALIYKPINSLVCGGSIINHRTILTAAHCIRLFPNPNDVSVLAGQHNITSNTMSQYAGYYDVYDYVEHPYYDPLTDANDIGIIITVDIINWSRGVGPICLPLDQLGNNFDYTNITVAGWGTTAFSGSKSDTLQKTSMNVLPNSVCQRIYPALQSEQMCTHYKGRDACQYDSGGPVICRVSRLYLLGIIMSGSACGIEPGVNTRVTSYVYWILGNSAGNVCFKPFR